MVANLEDIGFEVFTEEAKIKGFIQHIIKNGSKKDTRMGNSYYVFNPNDNIELWFFIDREGNPSMTPFYSGKSRQKIKVIDAVINSKYDSPKLHSWVNPSDENEGDTQVVFEVPDFWLMDFDRLRGMDRNMAQLSVFARDVRLYKDEKDFQDFKGEIGKTADGKVLAYSSTYFIPTGAFIEPMDSFARFAGKVKEAREIRNDFSGREFYSMIVNTFFGDLDVVCAKRAFEKSPIPGNVIDGDFYVAGKLVFD